MKNVTVSKLVSDKLKTKAQGKGGVYDGTYGKDTDKPMEAEADPTKVVIPENSVEQHPEAKATSVEEPAEKVAESPDAKPMCKCSVCNGTGMVAEPEVKAEAKEDTDSKDGMEAQGTTGTYDGEYGGSHAQAGDLNKFSLDVVFNRPKLGLSDKHIKFHQDVNGLFAGVGADLAKRILNPKAVQAESDTRMELPNFAKK